MSRSRSPFVPRRSFRVLAFVAAALASLASSRANAAGQVYVVAPAVAPGVDFTNLQTALNAAGNGDVLLLKTGTYGAPFTQYTLNGKGVTLVEDAGQTVSIGQLAISNIAAGQMVCVRGINIAAEDLGVALSVSNSTGAIWIEDAVLTSTSTVFPFLPAGEGARLTNCADVTLARCTLNGATITTGTFTGYSGLRATSSNVALYDCACNGGSGGNGAAAFFGGDGALVDGGFLYASGTTFKGGKGGNGSAAGTGGPFNPCTNGAPGGHALHLGSSNPSVATLACTFTPGLGGAAGSGGSCVAGATGSTVKIDSGAHTPLAGSAHSLTCNATCREGQTFTLTFKGAAGELAFLDLGGLQGFTYFPEYRGVLVLGFPLFTLFQGTVPSSGTLVKTSGVINDLGVATEGVTLYMQSAFASANGGIFQAGPSATVLLDASL